MKAPVLTVIALFAITLFMLASLVTAGSDTSALQAQLAAVQSAPTQG